MASSSMLLCEALPVTPPGVWRRDQLLGKRPNCSTAVQSPLKASRQGTLLRQIRHQRQIQARDRDKSKIAHLESLLEDRPQYVVIQKEVLVENYCSSSHNAVEIQTDTALPIICEAAIQTDDSVPMEYNEVQESSSRNMAPKMYTEEALLEFFNRHSQPLRDELAAEHSTEVDALRQEVAAKIDNLQSLNIQLVNENADLKSKLDKFVNISTSENPVRTTNEFELLTSLHKKVVAETAALKSELRALQHNFEEQVHANSDSYLQALLNVVQLPSDDHGVVIGISSNPTLNGSVVHVQEWHHDRQRWQVCTSEGRSILLKPENILRKSTRSEDSSASNQSHAEQSCASHFSDDEPP